MSISIFKFGSRQGTSINLPLDRNSDTSWHPRINDRFPGFTARSTRGQIGFPDWADGSWVLLVSHPAAFTPVCTTEIRALAERHAEFEERHVKVIALTGDTLDRIREWTCEIERDSGITVPFPHISDENHVIVRGCGLLSHEPVSGGKFCARRSLLIDPCGIVRMIMDYPLAVGRSVDETLRSIDALMVSERLGVLAPSDWQLGEPLLLNHEISPREKMRRCGMEDTDENPYFRMIEPFARRKGRSRPPQGERFPEINNIELRLIVDEHNRRMKPGATPAAMMLSGVFAPLRT